MEENKSFQFSTIEEALDDLRAGKIILCTDCLLYTSDAADE